MRGMASSEVRNDVGLEVAGRLEKAVWWGWMWANVRLGISGEEHGQEQQCGEP